jgi:hypothetical protein
LLGERGGYSSNAIVPYTKAEGGAAGERRDGEGAVRSPPDPEAVYIRSWSRSLALGRMRVRAATMSRERDRRGATPRLVASRVRAVAWRWSEVAVLFLSVLTINDPTPLNDKEAEVREWTGERGTI